MKLKIASLLFVACVPTLCAAQQQRPGHASEWVRLSGAQVRLVALPVDPSGPDAWQAAGVEIRLEPGVKTYWRAPGDTGVPPTIDFSPSQGVRELTLDFPAPVGFDDGAGGMAIGYRETQIFPVRFKLEKPAEPTSTGGGFFSRKVEAPPPPVPPKLEMNIEFGICTKNMCVPAQAKAALALGGGTLEAALGDRIAAANARVPVRQKVGAPGAVGISSVHVRRKAGMAEIEVAARVGNDTGTAGLFIEAKETLVAKRTDAPIGGSVVFRAKTADPADGKLGEARITLATDKGAVDVLVDLDAAARRP